MCCRNIELINRIVFFIAILAQINTTAQTSGLSFTDITQEAGISFKYNFGDYTYENILESSGSGVTILDYNSDGWMDLYMLNGTYLEGISDAKGILDCAGYYGCDTMD